MHTNLGARLKISQPTGHSVASKWYLHIVRQREMEMEHARLAESTERYEDMAKVSSELKGCN